MSQYVSIIKKNYSVGGKRKRKMKEEPGKKGEIRKAEEVGLGWVRLHKVTLGLENRGEQKRSRGGEGAIQFRSVHQLSNTRG